MGGHSELGQQVQEIVSRMARLALTRDGHIEELEGAAALLEELFRVVGSEDVGEPIAEGVRAGALSRGLGRELLGVVPWAGRTNGADLQPTIEAWLLDGKDRLRVGLALEQDAFPFLTVEEMASVLGELSHRFPEYAPTCASLIARRAQQGV